MATKRKRIVRYTDEELRARRAAGKVGSDWKRAAHKRVPSGANPDDAIGPVDMEIPGATRAPVLTKNPSRRSE